MIKPLFRPRPLRPPRLLRWLCLSACCFQLAAFAQAPVAVQFSTRNFTGYPSARTITITPSGDTLLETDGTNVITGSPLVLPATTNMVTTNLWPGKYTITLQGISKSWTIAVTTNLGYGPLPAVVFTTNLVVYVGTTPIGSSGSAPAGTLTNGQTGVVLYGSFNGNTNTGGSASTANSVMLADGVQLTGLTATPAALAWTNSNSLLPPQAVCSFPVDGQFAQWTYSNDGTFQVGSGKSSVASQYRAQASFTLCSIKVWLEKTGSPAGNLYAYIASDVGTNPAVLLSTMSSPVAAGTVTGSGGFSVMTFPLSCSIVSNSLYWVCISNTIASDSGSIQPAYAMVDATTPAQSSRYYSGGAWHDNGEDVRLTFIAFQ